MQITYEDYQRQTAQKRGRSGGSRTGGKRKKTPLARREVRRLGQLAVSLALFLTVFAGKSLMPEEVQTLGALLRQDTDLAGACARLGQAVSQGAGLEAVEAWCAGVFLPAEEGETVETASNTSAPDFSVRAVATIPGVEPAAFWAEPEEETQLTADQQGTEAAMPSAETLAVAGAETAADPLGVGGTVTPVMGALTSGFGAREHPVSGGDDFHNGVDIAVNKGTEVLAFADGVVDFIGTSPAYGNYIQLRHANGVTSFYAHCSELLLSTGTAVKAGDVIALSGDTGNVTGPHLHFELEINDTRVDPAPYLDFS